VTKEKESTTVKQYKTTLAGRDLIIETGKLAQQASGAVTVRYGDTVVLATVVVGEEPREGVDFFPLLVDYEERLYAAGKISSSRFIKREGRPSERAVLTCRLIDRSLRPLFPHNFRNDIQVIITVLSVDKENDPDLVSVIAASSALILSPAPFEGPVAAGCLGLIDGKFIFNPSHDELLSSHLDLTVSFTDDKPIMIETAAKEVPEGKIIEGIKLIQKELKGVLELQKKLPRGEAAEFAQSDEIHQKIEKYLGKKLADAVEEADKLKREAKIADFEKMVMENFEGDYKQVELKEAFSQLVEREVRRAILERSLRPDGRKLDEIREISIEVGLLPRTHGSALFTRGQTQALTIATLGSPGEEQVIETMEEEGTKRFMHHYNFPPFSTGEVQPLRGASRREIGHGALAEKALLAVIPTREEFPYTIRLVSEILSSNGSTSMAATCGASLALMDAGVPIIAPVAGISIGLMTADEKNPKKDYKLLTDIQGIEDFAGDMDFKIAGTPNGVTAIQMDVKIQGLDLEILEEAMKRAKQAREAILQKMQKIIASPRSQLSPWAPRIKTVKIDPEKIALLIGPGGKTINKLIAECGGREITSIDIEEDGTVLVSSTDAKMGEKAAKWIENFTREVEVGEIFQGEVTSILKDRHTGKEIGALVKILPNREGMVHISQLADHRVANVSEVVQPGKIIPVKVIAVDKERDRISLSLKAAQEEKRE